MIKFIQSLLLIFLFFFTCNSQEIENYEPYSMIDSDNNNLIDSYNDKLKKELDSIQNYRSDFKEILKKRNDRLEYKIENRHFIIDDKVTSYFSFILKEICSNNQELNENEITLFIARYPWENAVCYNEGTIILNLGLYRKLKNESQIAMVLAHELAHYHLKHGNKIITDYVKTINSKEYKDEIKEIKRTKFNRRQRAIKLFKEITYNERKHSRINEMESDSLALRFLMNTRYDIHKAAEAIGVLDSIDKDKYENKINYDELFNFQEYPFDNNWLVKESESIFEATVNSDNPDGLTRDSLKTHPDCLQRFEQLEKQLENFQENRKNKFVQDSLLFEALIQQSDFEYINSHMTSEQYGKALFYALKLRHHQPYNVFLINIIGRCFYEFYFAQKHHELGKYVELESSHYSKEYKRFLTFVRNLNLSDYKMIGYNYMKGHYMKMRVNEDYLHQLILSSSILEDKSYLNKYISEYNSSFPQGNYLEEVNSILEQ